jgi:hypothetical protein
VERAEDVRILDGGRVVAGLVRREEQQALGPSGDGRFGRKE